ncbi:MAG: molybdopterin-dependent oxidoreductase [Verrucomicrobia bacterium]|nr:molybdopterin-dependent oxidoreductase [Verrucomicrobiota bacterium]
MNNACENGLKRRDFLVTLAGGLSVGFLTGITGRLFGAGAVTTTPVNSYVKVGSDGSITLLYGGSEMGQGSMSGLAQILAEELMVDWKQIVVEQALAGSITYVTGGSSAVRTNYSPLRTAGATARELLVAAAMLATGDQTRSSYAAASGKIVYTPSGGGATLTWNYGDLAVLAAGTDAQALLPAVIPLTNPANFRIIGKPVARVDIPSKVNGSAIYGIDVWFPDMVFGVIKHCPTIGGVLAITPAKPAAAIAVVPCKASDNRGAVVAGTYNAVAVVASNTWAARNIARSLSVSWKLPTSTTNVDSAGILAQAQQLLTSGTPLVAESSNPGANAPNMESQVASAMTGAAKQVGGTFSFPYVAHATMEPLNCTAKITFSGSTPVSCEIWAPTQAANWVVGTAAGITGLPATAITVHVTMLGGGLGRKIEQDYISQAVQVAMVVKKPVKLTWLREEDFGHDNYRPMALVQANAGLDAANKIAAWSYRIVTPSILGQRGWLPPGAVDSQAVEGAVHLPYNLGTYITEWVSSPAGIPLGFWRSVGCSLNSFVTESMIDMLAKTAGIDPFVFRAGLITDPRAKAVLAAADSLSSWRKSLVAGHAWGMAIVQSFGTWVCEVIEISQPVAGSLKIHRVACVVDCGTVVNPDSVEAQMQGGILHGLSNALWGQMTFTNGVANQTNFNKYRMLKMSEAPTITVQIMPSTAAPSGTGEPGVPPSAPALANAYASLSTGKRVTSLPFFPGATMGGL